MCGATCCARGACVACLKGVIIMLSALNEPILTNKIASLFIITNLLNIFNVRLCVYIFVIGDVLQ